VTTLLAFVFVLGVLVFVHELGHFLMARWHGVRVLTFSLGFGPKLAKVRRGDTEYCISAIPLGGYVKMAGETVEDQRTGSPDEFLSKTKWQRFQILVMGPIMNLALAVILMAGVLMQGAETPAFLGQPAVVGLVQPGSPAEQAGIRPGDVIVRVGGLDIDRWEQLEMAISSRPDRDLDVTVMRNGREERLKVRPASTTLTTRSNARFEVGTIGVLPDTYPVVRSVLPGEPAERAGLKSGDHIVSIDGTRVVFNSQVLEAISSRAGQPVRFVIRRDGMDQELIITPEKRGESGKVGIEVTNPTVSFKPGPLEAVALSVEHNVDTARMILVTLRDLLVGAASPRQLMGPVGIAQISGESAQLGWLALFSLMATISLNLGLLNLLPIPILDGGHIAIMLLEAVARRDFSVQVKEKMLLAGFVLLMMLMVTVIYNDLARIAWIERLMPWRN
jgi:regulator of sigma E protease